MKASFGNPRGSFSLGPFLKCPYPEIVECCGIAGFDFVVADLEHTPVSPRELLPLLLAAKHRDLELIARIPENSPSYFKWCLDLGVNTIQVPHVQSKEDAERAIAASHFSPSGDRGLCRFVRAAGYSSVRGEEYLRQANERARIILQIEGIRGIRNLSEILAVEGIDTIFIGPYDLSQSLGFPGEIGHPAVLAAMDEALEKCAQAKVKVGTFADTPEGIRRWAARGVKLIEYGSDLHLFLAGAAAIARDAGMGT